MGNQVAQQLLRDGVIQAKLTISQPGDVCEQEADRVADQVLTAPTHSAVSGAPPCIQRFTGQPSAPAGTAPSSVDQALASPGRPLEPALRQDMEQRFGYDFSRVRVHTDAGAEQSAQSINALAYTVGQSVVFGAGQYVPGTSKGKRLLAHELAHVIQQYPSDVSGLRNSYGAPTMVYRSDGSGGSTRPRRIVYLDNDVLGEIADGNNPLAEKLQRMRASGADVRMTRYNYVEAIHGEPIRAGARKLIVQKLGITIDEGGGLASRAATYVELSTGKEASVQPKDVPMIAAVRAAGPDAELWSIDGGPKEQAKRFGIRLAPESGKIGEKIARVKTPDVRAGLNNVGLQAWEIGSDGTPIRRGQLLGYRMATPGPKVPPSGSERSKAVTTASGAAGGAPSAVTSTSSEIPKTPPPTPATPETKISPGAFPSSAAAGQEATAGAAGAAAAMIHQGQIEYFQNAEQAKADEALKRLQPEIDRLVARGRWVVVQFHFDAPKAPSITAGVFKEQSDINHFVMITYKTGATKAEALGKEPAKMKEVLGPPETYGAPQKPLGADRTTFIADEKVYLPQYNPKAIKGPYSFWDLIDFTAGKIYVDSENKRYLRIRWVGGDPILTMVDMKTMKNYVVQEAHLDVGKQMIHAVYVHSSTAEIYDSRFLITPMDLGEMIKRGGPGRITRDEAAIWERRD
jgi:hypothetical protein